MHKSAIDDIERSTWPIGQRVSRKDTSELGIVVGTNGQIKVKWDGGATSYFAHGKQANVEIVADA